MRANATPPSAAIAAAAVATNPAPYPKIRVGSELFDTLEPNEPSREHMEQERRMLELQHHTTLSSKNRNKTL
ncbi:hypothetical protein DAPPUDRAFT_234110 [Daphnia pulex]|uniref:Uncharacterized protein n=1 Tax=Daphnia pulex TaxID=6669 RepID=E9FUL3_DAPPU|nr:hypothetical protein DAPPUDRAFT_234110 [Daphnia pulex]|eukprot:EFX88752.1 hypothetical protein DAPPUDRAFT_234110 [Daphnia pulex]